METPFTETLRNHPDLELRRNRSVERLRQVSARLTASPRLSEGKVTPYAAGSLARGEAGRTSDLDVFLTTDDQETARSRLCTFEVIADLIRVNQEEGFPEFSNDGQYLRIYSLDELTAHTGSSDDDEGNYFTARMLMLLEAQPLIHEERFREQQARVMENYFRDGAGKDDFKPLFLLNDILRYWRTLCLNYEQTRYDRERRWRKKNVNLKFSRMVTVFATVLPLITLPRSELEPGALLWTLRPFERLALALDRLGDRELLERWPSFLDAYEEFLTWKDVEDIEARLGQMTRHIRTRAAEVSDFLYDALDHQNIPRDLRRYLVL